MITLIGIAVIGVIGVGRPALAHAELLEITPADGSFADASLPQVELRFSEHVSLTGGAASVLDDQAATVSTGAQVVDDRVVISLPGSLADGTYTVTWQVISEDSHRISGASIFYVGVPSAGGGAAVAAADSAGWGVRLGAVALSTAAYAGALIGVGGWWWVVLLRGGRDDELDVPGGERWRTVVSRSMIVGAVTLVAALPFRIARVGGGLGALRDNDFLVESLRGPIGTSTVVTAGALLVGVGVLAVDSSRRVVRWLAAIVGATALAGFAIEGHTRSQQPPALMVMFDVVHLAAAALWIGGITGLVVAFRTDPSDPAVGPVPLARMVRRFSAAAVGSVVVVAAAGIGMSWIILPSWSDLVDTGYGLALLTKVALVVVVVALGAYNNRRLVPLVGDSDRSSRAARRLLGRIVRVELAVLLAVLAVTAVLVSRSPIASSSGTPPAPTVPADAVELPLTSGAGTATLSVAPSRVGTNEMRLTLFDPSGQPLDPLDVTVELTEPTLGLGPLRPVVHPLGTGDFHVIAEVPLAGSWQVTVRVRVSDFDAATAETVVAITD